LFLLLFFNNTFADTLLDSVELDNGYNNYYLYMDIVDVHAPPCSYLNYPECVGIIDSIKFSEMHDIWDSKLTETIIPIQQDSYQFLVKSCKTDRTTQDFNAYSNDCSLCTFSRSYDNSNCWESQTNKLTIFSGSARMNFDLNDQNCWCVASADCGYGRPREGSVSYSGESSYTFRVKCEGEKIARLLKIQSDIKMLMSETLPSLKGFLINGYPPTRIYQGIVMYNECDRVYFSQGTLIWDIPINVRCGENITITPSLTTGYGMPQPATINYVKAIFDCPVDINVTPTDVMPKKTGNNKADVVLTLSNPAPSEGVNVKLTVEPVKGSGGHVEDGHTGARLKGEITDDSGSKIDTVKFAEGETQKMVKYKADEVAGEEKIIAEIVNTQAKCEETVNVKVPGLMRLDDGENYDLKESTNIHPSSYWGAMDALGYFNSIANAYAVTFPNDSRLVVTDISLPWGGVFDLCGTYNPKDKCSAASNGGHSSHRTGRDVDVRNSNIPMENRKEFEIICKYYWAVPNNHGNHYHLDF
jgi:hypothetical protein